MKHSLIALALVAALPFAASAQDANSGLSYNYVQGGYVAQEFAAPGERRIRLDGELLVRKVDVRLYIYGGQLLLTAARLYQGQTTNFRTPGGGFAPLLAAGGHAAICAQV